MGLVEELYSKEDVALRTIWKKHPFNLFNPQLPFLSFKLIRQAIDTGDKSIFTCNIGNNFFPDKTPTEVLEAKRNAMNRGISALNLLCNKFLPQAYTRLRIEPIQAPFNPLDFFSTARDWWLETRDERHKSTSNPASRAVLQDLILRAYDRVRAWGLGHLVLIIDESPEVYHSVSHYPAINEWLWQQFDFKHPTKSSDNTFAWETSAGVKVLGTKEKPFRQRAKIYDDYGSPRYDALLIKMFLKQEFTDRIHDHYGVEFVVEDDEAMEHLIRYFRGNIRSAATLEKYDKVKKSSFRCTKFVVRMPIRVKGHSEEELLPIDSSAHRRPKEKDSTLKNPIGKYIRIPVEFQIVPRQEASHEEYERQRYLRVLPLWYPRDIYEPILEHHQS